VLAAELLAHPGFVAFLSSVFEVVDFLAFYHIEFVIADNHLDLVSHNQVKTFARARADADNIA